MVCLSASVVAHSLSPSFAVEVAVFILPVKKEAETASVIKAPWLDAEQREKDIGFSNHALDCKESQCDFTQSVMLLCRFSIQLVKLCCDAGTT